MQQSDTDRIFMDIPGSRIRSHPVVILFYFFGVLHSGKVVL